LRQFPEARLEGFIREPLEVFPGVSEGVFACH
jgi:hypothetical protein